MPGGTSKSLSAPSRAMLPDICKGIHRVIEADWAEVEFTVVATEDDSVVVRFSLMTLESELGVEAYMNCFYRKNGNTNFNIVHFTTS